VLLTAKAELEDRVAGRKLGVDTYLAKPFHPAELVASVEGLLRARLTLVGPYVLHRPLGAGGQSEVFVGEHVDTGQLAALKLLGRSATGAVARERLKREAQALEKLAHPNVVRVLAHGFGEDHAYLATELLNGASLKQVLATLGPLKPGAVAEIGVALCDALQAVHASGLVHRDIKCENVMLLKTPEALGPRVRLIDFGIAAQEGADADPGRSGGRHDALSRA
jgi:serine/threonine-protein kinase